MLTVKMSNDHQITLLPGDSAVKVNFKWNVGYYKITCYTALLQNWIYFEFLDDCTVFMLTHIIYVDS